MTIDLAAATAFMATHARLLDRRRFQALAGDGGADDVLAALHAYGNDDGGYGWGLEPDFRSPESQPGGALHAFEVFEEIGPATSPHARALCDWLASATLSDGGLPFALPVTNPAGCAPFWAEADSSVSSLHITSAVAGAAHRVARHDPAVAAHPWLERATDYCISAIGEMSPTPHAIEVMFVLQFLDAVVDGRPDAAKHMASVGRAIPRDGLMPVGGGLDEEFIRPLDVAPVPDRPVRALFTDDAVAADLERLAVGQHSDGGWSVDFTNYSPQAALEWRGYMTVRAVSILRGHGLVSN